MRQSLHPLKSVIIGTNRNNGLSTSLPYMLAACMILDEPLSHNSPILLFFPLVWAIVQRTVYGLVREHQILEVNRKGKSRAGEQLWLTLLFSPFGRASRLPQEQRLSCPQKTLKSFPETNCQTGNSEEHNTSE